MDALSDGFLASSLDEVVDGLVRMHLARFDAEVLVARLRGAGLHEAVLHTTALGETWVAVRSGSRYVVGRG